MKTGRGWPIAGALVATLGGSIVGPHAQGARPMTLVNLAELPRVQDVQLSPDGRHVSYMLAQADWTANRLVPHIWRQTIGGGSPVQLTSTDGGDSFARWSPDSRALLFIARGDGGAQIFTVPAEGGPVTQVTHQPSGVSSAAPPAWSPDGSAIYYLANDPPSTEHADRQRQRDDVYAFEGDATRRHLWRVNVASGAAQKVGDGPYSILGFKLSRDGTRVVTHRAPSLLPDAVVRGEVWVSDAAGLNGHAVTRNDLEEFDAEMSPDNAQVLFLAEANAALESYFVSTVFVAPAAGGTPTMLAPDFPYAIDRATWAPDGRSVLAVANMGAHSEIVRIGLADRRVTVLTDGPHSVQFWSLTPAAGRMAFQFDEPTRPGDAWTLPVDGGVPTRVTGIYDSLATEFDLPRQEKRTWKSADGTTVEGILFYPPGYQPGRRVPLVVQLHGGPIESDKFGFGPGVVVNYVPVLTARGYAVLRPNYRGSAGYGNRFLRGVIGDYFGHMQADVLTGVDALVAGGIADGDRLAVMGWSAGGHLVNKLVTTTTRFKAAASTAGVANWISLFAQSDTFVNRAVWFGGLPWGPRAAPDTFWNSSPLKDVARVRTPTLLIAGENDARVPMAQAIEMYRALTANGVETRLYVAPREGHQWGELRHQLFKANAELEWFERHVLGRTYTWERAPH
jgi:dipeptidyl aminopeptidase/acylaminoacyl peptidase